MPEIPGHCPACGAKVIVPLPVEPLFNRTEVCALVPVKLSSLWRMTNKYKHLLSPAMYIGPKRRALRQFTAQDVRVLRALRLRSEQ